jgi:two-component system sensor histidine kinase CpxA
MLLVMLAVAVTGLGSAALARQLARPVVRLRSDVRTIAAGKIDERMSPTIARRSDEVGGLARDIDLMTSHLRSLIESKEELLRDISHELRSPLARLRIATSLLRGEWTGADTQAFDRIDREVQRLDALIGQILQFSRIQANPDLSFAQVDLAEIVDETVADARLEANGTKPINFVRGPAALVDGDRALIASAIENVLRNAIRFGPCGLPIELRLERIGNIERVSICDHGPGIPSGDLSRICEPFFRAAGSTGVGLGLSIAERVATLHGGRIAIRNRPDRGLEVQLFFLASGSDHAPLADFSNAQPIGNAG